MMNMGGGGPQAARLPAYLAGASNSELATLMQQARDPALRMAVGQEVQRRQQTGGGSPGARSSSVPSMPPYQLQTAMPEAPNSGSDGAIPTDSPYKTAGDIRANPPLMPDSPNSGFQGGPRSARGEDVPPVRAMAGSSWTPPWDRTPDVASQAIATGTAAADDVTGNDLPPALTQQMQAMDQADDPTIQQQVIKRLMGGDDDKGTDIAMSLARAGFTMAASNSPHGLTALGEGALAGLDSYDKARQREAENQTKAADIESGMQRQREVNRSNRVGEGFTGQQVEIARRNAVLAQKEFDEKTRQFNAGFATDEAVKRAQIASNEASAGYSRALQGQVGVQTLTNENGELMRVQGDKATPVIGADGKPVKAFKLGAAGAGTAQMRNIQDLMTNLHIPYEQAYGMIKQGSSMAPDRRRAEAMRIAQQAAAANVQLLAADPADQQKAISDMATQIEGMMVNGLGGPEVPTGNGGPAINSVPAPTNGGPSAMPAVPAPLQDRAAKLQWNQNLKRFRDSSTGEMFDANGNLVQ